MAESMARDKGFSLMNLQIEFSLFKMPDGRIHFERNSIKARIRRITIAISKADKILRFLLIRRSTKVLRIISSAAFSPSALPKRQPSTFPASYAVSLSLRAVSKALEKSSCCCFSLSAKACSQWAVVKLIVSSKSSRTLYR